MSPHTPPPTLEAPPRSERLLALAVAGAIAVNPPLLRLFGAPDLVFGWPLLYVYIFAVWALVIGLVALHVERAPRGADPAKAEAEFQEER